MVQLVTDVEHAQQNELPAAFMSLSRTQDPVWTTGHGKRLSGWGKINTFTYKVLPSAMKHSTASYEVVRILFVRPDVAAVNVRQRPVQLDGTIEDQPEGRPFYILAKDDGEWKIAAAQRRRPDPPGMGGETGRSKARVEEPAPGGHGPGGAALAARPAPPYGAFQRLTADQPVYVNPSLYRPFYL
ncbi:SgcJ/EcaC family oxidoreductase [Nonomuraea sp. NPDC049152]|uniref:SgcJ/EcaC family oxidoreductase n=1 Tax=Nonomuraea sp. NPDC049152 TaxID=3154350 RepID=UPI0033EFB0A9